MCNKVKVIVDDLKKENTEGNITYQTIKIGTPAVDAEVQKAGLELHGLVATAADGSVVEAVEGHSYGKAKIEKVVKSLLNYKG